VRITLSFSTVEAAKNISAITLGVQNYGLMSKYKELGPAEGNKQLCMLVK
jgi:hypothetical protein